MIQKKHKKQKKNQIEYKNMNAFKAEEKKYKLYQDRQTDFSQLMDISTMTDQELQNNEIKKNGNIYRFKYPEGVILVKEFLSLNDQISVVSKCMNEYIHHPYRNNLFIYDQQENFDKFTTHQDDKYHFNHRIRWTNVGQQYDWNNRKYPEQKTNVPAPIQEIAQRANALVNNQAYDSQAVIINFYQEHDYMTAHLDDAEEDQTSPIYSFSFGLSCIFLIGGPTKDEIPLALKLESGDLLVMSGPSRKAFHGVPRVLNEFKYGVNPYPEQPLNGNLNSDFHVFNYLKTNRVNINTRQVYKQ